jgi:hypothetical protein
MDSKITISLSYGEAQSLLKALPNDGFYGVYESERPLYDLRSTLCEILGEEQS